eukprot:Gb_08508 [translate_table: standard]
MEIIPSSGFQYKCPLEPRGCGELGTYGLVSPISFPLYSVPGCIIWPIVKQPSSKLDLSGVLPLPISFVPFESFVFTSIIVLQANFLGHLSGIIVGYAIALGLIQGMYNYWAVSMLCWIIVAFVFSLKRTSALELPFIEIKPEFDASLQTVGVFAANNAKALT